MWFGNKREGVWGEARGGESGINKDILLIILKEGYFICWFKMKWYVT